MERADKAPDRSTQHQPAARFVSGPAAAPAFVDRSARSAQLTAMVQMMQRSPQVAELGSLVQMMQTSPQVTAQLALNARLAAGATAVTQRVEGEEDELLQGKFDTVQRFEGDEEELLQGKFVTVQRFEGEDEEPLQGKFAPIQRVAAESAPRPNQTGLPDGLKSGIESLSGISLDQVRVHYNSSQPAQLNAHAYAQGSEIHLAPGQEQHLPHEAWHVVQQAQGRVRPTLQLHGGVPVNDDAGLEREADVMGAKATEAGSVSDQSRNIQRRAESAGARTQLKPADGQCGKEPSNLLSSSSFGLAQKAANNVSGTHDASQLRKIDVLTKGITHLVQINNAGSLYQADFEQNEVAETDQGDSIVIETDYSIRSRRGPNQEKADFRSEPESNHVWINAITHNDEVLPVNSFIRDGTFVERKRPKSVFNLASGTVPNTLMHPNADEQEVLNIDSGHMAVADAAFAYRKDNVVVDKIAHLLVLHNPKNQFSLGKGKNLQTENDKIDLLKKQMIEKDSTFNSNLKLLLHDCYRGKDGALSFLKEMPKNVQQYALKNLNNLTDFRHGDLESGSGIAKEEGQADVVHMVNAFGFDPIEDEQQVVHLANMLRPGGRLVITAEATGPTVKPLWKGSNLPNSSGELFALISTNLRETEIGKYFYLGPLIYPHGMPVNYGARSAVMPSNSFTRSMETTRHTMPSEKTTEMVDSTTVQITFVRNNTPPKKTPRNDDSKK